MLLDSLKRKCVESLLPEGEWARTVLQVTPSVWSSLKTGRYPISRIKCQRIAETFPDLRTEVVQYRYLQEGMDPDTLSEADAVAAS